MNRKRILFRVEGYKEISMGHIYRCLTIAELLNNHEVMFVTSKQSKEGITLLEDNNINFTVINASDDIFLIIQKWSPNILINDCLNSKPEYMKRIKSMVERVIAIEDIGEGSIYADAVINALYNEKGDDKKYFYGEKYHCLRNEFMKLEPKAFVPVVKNVIITFGGSDPSNLTKKLYSSVKGIHKLYPSIHFTFICGPAYDRDSNGIHPDPVNNINVFQNIKNISYYMKQSDIALTSQGSAIFELASLGVPAIVMAQNKREQSHTFARLENGFINLGLGNDLTAELIQKTISWLIETPIIRSELRTLMLKNDLKKGAERISNIILNDCGT